MGRWKNNPKTILWNFFKERPSKLKKGYSQDLVKQTIVHNFNVIMVEQRGLYTGKRWYSGGAMILNADQTQPGQPPLSDPSSTISSVHYRRYHPITITPPLTQHPLMAENVIRPPQNAQTALTTVESGERWYKQPARWCDCLISLWFWRDSSVSTNNVNPKLSTGFCHTFCVLTL